MKRTTERKWHSWLNGVALTICPSMWRRQRRLCWTSGGGTSLTTPHWPSTAQLWRVSSTKFLGVHITEDLTWTTNTMSLSNWPLRVCWPAASLSGTGTAVLLTARPSSRQWTRLQRSSVPLSHPSWTFSLHDAPAKPTASWRTPPTPPTVSSSSYHQEDGTGASEPAPPDCSTAFSHRLWEPWTQITPPPSETPCKPLPPETRTPSPLPPPLQAPPNLTTPKKKLWTFLCNSSVLHTGEWACTNHL